jgi:glutathione S-transferase
MRLFGTPTSPYTRKARLLVRAAGLDAPLVDTRTEEGAAALARVAPLGKVPVLEVADASGPPLILPDSGVIAAWLWTHHALALRASGYAPTPEGWDERGALVVVEGALDAAINRFYLLRDGLPDQGYVTRQRDRVTTALTWLEARLPAFERPLTPAALSLGCALDWMVFRGVQIPPLPRLAAFRDAWTASGLGAGTEPA